MVVVLLVPQFRNRNAILALGPLQHRIEPTNGAVGSFGGMWGGLHIRDGKTAAGRRRQIY